jgi:predicted aldo/keto reductase-like oxidoreductase
MLYREFGSTGFKVSALGLGCMRLPTAKFNPQRVNTKKSLRLIRNAIDQGVNYIDTAWPYHFGESERIIGMALQDGYRERVHLVTKLLMSLVREEEDFNRFLNKQLEKLQTSYLDTYLFHALNKIAFEKVKRLNLIDKMVEAKKQGKIKYIGFSFHDTQTVFKEIIDYYDWDVTQIQYSYMDTAIQATEEGLKYAGSKNIAVVVMEPVKGGLLARPSKKAKEVMARSKIKRSAVDWALQYLWNIPEVSVVISGMGSQKMLDENCVSAEKSGINSLSVEDLSIIDELADIYRKDIIIPCTTCLYCMNCPSGVNIPQNFAILNNFSMEKRYIQRWMVKRSYKNFVGDPEKVNQEITNGNALVCTDCRICIKKCPQGIDIPNELKKVDLVLGKGKKLNNVFDRN